MFRTILALLPQFLLGLEFGDILAGGCYERLLVLGLNLHALLEQGKLCEILLCFPPSPSACTVFAAAITAKSGVRIFKKIDAVFSAAALAQALKTWLAEPIPTLLGAARDPATLGLHVGTASLASACPACPTCPSLSCATSTGPTCPASHCECNCRAPEPARNYILAGALVALVAGGAGLLVGLALGSGVALVRPRRAAATPVVAAQGTEPVIAILGEGAGPVTRASRRNAFA